MAGFTKKKCEQAYLKFGVYGPTGSGKTLTSLLCAEGLAAREKKRTAYVDTEYGTDFYVQDVPARTVHPKAFDIDALNTRSLTEIIEAVTKLDFSIYSQIILDSVTHVWDGTIAAYDGKRGPDGSIPMAAWGDIKRPYKDLINFLMNCPAHVFILGREGNEYRRDEGSDELTIVGKKMKAEGETAYEPHILLRLEPLKQKSKSAIYRVFAEKDRTGILGGRFIENPCFENICEPLLPLLGKAQARIADPDEVAVKDAQALGDAAAKKAKVSVGMREEFCARFQLAKSVSELDAVSKELTAGMKKLMTTADVSTLRDAYNARLEILTRPDVA